MPIISTAPTTSGRDGDGKTRAGACQNHRPRLSSLTEISTRWAATAARWVVRQKLWIADRGAPRVHARRAPVKGYKRQSDCGTTELVRGPDYFSAFIVSGQRRLEANCAGLSLRHLRATYRGSCVMYQHRFRPEQPSPPSEYPTQNQRAGSSGSPSCKRCDVRRKGQVRRPKCR